MWEIPAGFSLHIVLVIVELLLSGICDPVLVV
jgi:hypothetical protein